MKCSSTTRGAVALIVAYALALQPLLATFVWVAHAASPLPGQAVNCLGVVTGGGDTSGLPTGSDRICSCCMATNCGSATGAVDLPRSHSGPAPGIAAPFLSVVNIGAALSVLPAERYRPRAPPVA